MSRALSQREKIRFWVRGLEHSPMPNALRKTFVKGLPDPFAARCKRLPDGREIIFLHVPKTGGTSVAKALGLPPGHIPASRFEARDPARFAKAFRFAFVRDPVDRLFSSFNYLRTAIGLNRSPDVRWSETYLAQYDDFAAFVTALKNKAVRTRIMEWPHFRPMHSWLYRPKGTRPLVDFLGRFETLTEDCAALKTHLGVHIALPHTRKPVSYMEKTITPDIVEISRDIYRKDYDIFGY